MEDELLKYYKVPTDDLVSVPAVYTPISPEERKRRVAELNQQVKENVERIQNSAEFRKFLIAMSRFHNYSWNNQMLIWLQRPDATHVAGYNTWRDLGRFVKQGQAGITILAPLGPTSAVTWTRATDRVVYSIRRSDKGWAIYDDNGKLLHDGFRSYAEAGRKLKEMGFVEHREMLSAHNFKIVHVFDMSQTEGEPLPEFDIPALTGEANAVLWDDLLALAESQDLYVRFESKPTQDPGIKGSYEPPSLIWVRPEEAPAQQLKTLLHELAHHYTESVFHIPRADAETIAESAAYIVGAHHGFDTGVRSFPYVALWARDEKTLYANMKTVQEVSEKIIDLLERQRTRLIPMTSEAPPTKQIERAEMKYSAAEIREMACKHGITGDSKRDLCRKLIRRGVLK